MAVGVPDHGADEDGGIGHQGSHHSAPLPTRGSEDSHSSIHTCRLETGQAFDRTYIMYLYLLELRQQIICLSIINVIRTTYVAFTWTGV